MTCCNLFGLSSFITSASSSSNSVQGIASGVQSESVSFADVSDSTTDDSTSDNSGDRTSSSNSNSDDEIEWWVWILVAALGITIVSLIGAIVYFQKKINKLEHANTDNYQLMKA